jgi:hypothetical protein
MFDDLADPLGPPNADALAAVLARAQYKRHLHIRAIAAAVTFAVIVVVVTSVAFAAGSGGTSHRVVVAHQATSTTVAPATTTAPASTTTSAPAPTTTTAPKIVVPPSFIVRTGTTTTTIPHNPYDMSHVIAFFDPPTLTLRSGDTANVHVKYVNDGAWDVGWTHGDLSCPYTVDARPSGELQFYDTTALWPESPANPAVCPADASSVHLAPGESTTETVKILAGTEDIDGHIVPSTPGKDCFIPSYAPIGVDIKSCAGNVLPVTITPPGSAPFTVNRPTSVTVAANKEKILPFSLTNNLGFAVTFDFLGPKIDAVGAHCGRSADTIYIWDCTITVAAHQTLLLSLDVWGTQLLDPPPSSSPLKPGVHDIPWNEITLKLTVTP